MLEEIRQFDWSKSPLGAISGWPDPVKAAARMMLLSPVSMTLLLGRDGYVLNNDCARTMFGSTFHGALGKRIFEVLPDLNTLFDEALTRCSGGVGVTYAERKVELLRDDEWVSAWFDMSFTPIADESGEIFGALLTCADMSARMQALVDLQRSRERLDLALHHGGIVGTWEVNFQTETVTCDDRFARLHGVDPASAKHGVDREAFILGIHPSDRDVVLAVFQDAKDGRKDYRLQHRVIGGGDTRWIIASGRMFSDDSGSLSHFLGVVVDVTEQVQANLALGESEELLRALADTVPQMVFSADGDGMTDYMNKRWYEYTGLSRGEVSEEFWQTILHPDDRDRLVARWWHSIATGERYEAQFRARHHSGQYRWVRAMALPFRDSEGRITRWFGTNTDIHDAYTLAEQRELVAGELDHRIKNLFALVSALITLTKRDATGIGDLSERLQRRLTALHHAHELIAAGRQQAEGKTNASLEGLIRRILKPYEHTDNPVDFAGTDIDLNASVVTPLALVFHELATNSAKYGALSNPNGALRIDVRPDGEGTLIQWIESAVAHDPSASKGGGFGSSLLTLAVERQLNGKIYRDQRADGMFVELRLPVIGTPKELHDSRL